MKLNPLLLMAVGALALAGCSSTPTNVDTGPLRARTFNFVNTAGKPAPEFANSEPAIHAMVQNAITKNLAQRGLTRVAAGGDVTVGYLIIVGNNAATSSIRDYFGIHDDTLVLLDKAHKAYTSNQNPNYFEAGTLLIDIIDGQNFKLLQRHYATRPLIRNLSAEARADRIQGVVDEILRGVRVAP